MTSHQDERSTEDEKLRGKWRAIDDELRQEGRKEDQAFGLDRSFTSP